MSLLKPPVETTQGGTGRITLTSHGVLVGAGTASITQIAAGTAGQVLRSGGAGADPAYSTATYPATAGTSGNVLTSDGTNWVSSAPAGGGIITVNVVLTSAQVKALRATPITIAPAPGVGKVNIPVGTSWSKLTYGGTNPFLTATACSLKYKDGAGLSIVIQGIPVTTIQDTASNYSIATVAASLTDIAVANIENQPIVIHNTGGSEITGNAANNNTITVGMNYIVITI